jgi:DNA-binding YbaB/EbfC family protein
MMNFADMFGKINEMQSTMKQIREEMDHLHVEADAGGGMVHVKATASKKILKVSIDPVAIDRNEAELLEDLIVAAVNKALEKAEERGQAHMQEKTKDLLPGGGIPGLDLSKLGFGG